MSQQAVARSGQTFPLKEIGPYLVPHDERNTDLKITLSQGVANTKVFQSPKQVSSNSRADKIVRRGQFAYNRATTRNGEKISIAFREGEDCTVSGAYQVFSITDQSVIDPYYLLIWFSRSEFDRYARYMSKGSAHEFFEFSDMCRVKIPLPPIGVQRSVVEVWQGLRRLREDNEHLSALLMTACKAQMCAIKDKWSKVALGGVPGKPRTALVELCDERNESGIFEDVYGLNIDKTFMPTAANLESVDLKKYKVTRKGRFVFSGMQTGRDCCIRIGLWDREEPGLVSPAYATFEIASDRIMPEYLFALFCRREMDRLGWFMSDSSVRANLDWKRFCEIKIPLPPIEVQEAVVALYRCAAEAKKIAEAADAKLKSIGPALIKWAEKEGA